MSYETIFDNRIMDAAPSNGSRWQRDFEARTRSEEESRKREAEMLRGDVEVLRQRLNQKTNPVPDLFPNGAVIVVQFFWEGAPDMPAPYAKVYYKSVEGVWFHRQTVYTWLEVQAALNNHQKAGARISVISEMYMLPDGPAVPLPFEAVKVRVAPVVQTRGQKAAATRRRNAAAKKIAAKRTARKS